MFRYGMQKVFLLKAQVYLPISPPFFHNKHGKIRGQCTGSTMARKTASSASFLPWNWNSSLLPKLYNLIEPRLPHFVDIDITKTASFCSVSCRTSRLNPFVPIFKHFLNISAFKTQPKNSVDFLHLASSKLFSTNTHS